MVRAVHVRIGMVVRSQPADAVHVRAADGQIGKECLHQRWALQLLMLAVGIAVFLSAQRAGDIVHHGGQLQHLLRVPVQPFQLADGLRHGPDLEEMGNIVPVSVVKSDHFPGRGRNVFHLVPSCQSAVPVFGTKKRCMSACSSSSSLTFRAIPPP